MSILNQRFMTGCWSEHSERVDHCIIAREQPRARQRKERSWEDLHADSDDECLACCSSQSAFHSIPKNPLVGRTLRRMSPNSSPSARTCKAYDAGRAPSHPLLYEPLAVADDGRAAGSTARLTVWVSPRRCWLPNAMRLTSGGQTKAATRTSSGWPPSGAARGIKSIEHPP